jgi:hypothetical protein
MPHTKQTSSVHVAKTIVKLVVCVLLLVSAPSFGQTKTSEIIRERPRSSYDPGYRQNAQAQQSGISAALEKINPTDKDYGQFIDEARIAVIEQTVEDFYWWSCLVLTVLLYLALMYIIWLWKERELRLYISADIVTQLYNSHVASRAKALETIEMHNKLARRYNAKCTELTEARDAAAKSAEKNNRKGDSESVQKLSAKPQDKASENEQPCDQPEENSTTYVVSEADSDNGNESEVAGEISQAEKLKMQVRLLEGQVEAKNQQISNLRTRLNRAHHSLQEMRGQVSGEPQR